MTTTTYTTKDIENFEKSLEHDFEELGLKRTYYNNVISNSIKVYSCDDNVRIINVVTIPMNVPMHVINVITYNNGVPTGWHTSTFYKVDENTYTKNLDDAKRLRQEIIDSQHQKAYVDYLTYADFTKAQESKWLENLAKHEHFSYEAEKPKSAVKPKSKSVSFKSVSYLNDAKKSDTQNAKVDATTENKTDDELTKSVANILHILFG